MFKLKRKIIILATVHLSSANAFNFVTSKILSFGKGVNTVGVDSSLSRRSLSEIKIQLACPSACKL